MCNLIFVQMLPFFMKTLVIFSALQDFPHSILRSNDYPIGRFSDIFYFTKTHPEGILN